MSDTIHEELNYDHWELARDELRSRFENEDPLYKALIPEDRDYIITDDLLPLSKGAFITTKDATDLINGCEWMTERDAEMSDAMLRNWFNMEDLGLENYIAVIRSGRNRSYDVDAVIRLKLLCMWRYVKKCSLTQIRDMIYGVEHKVERTSSSTAIMTADQMKELFRDQAEGAIQRLSQVVHDTIATYEREVAGYKSQVADLESEVQQLRTGVDQFTAAREKEAEGYKTQVTDLENEVQQLRAGIEEYSAGQAQAGAATEQLIGMNLIVQAKLALTEEAEQKWMELGEKRFRKQLFGLVKFEDVDAYRKYVSDYVSSRLEERVEQLQSSNTEDSHGLVQD